MTVAPWTISSFQGCDRQRPLLSIRLRYVRPARRLRSVRSPVNPCVQFPEPRLKVCLVDLPCYAIHASGSFAPERVECRPKCIDIDVVEKRGEPFFLLQPCGVPYAAQRLCHMSPVLCPVRVLLSHVPLGLRPWLRQLRYQPPGFVRRLHSYYAEVRLLFVVHQRLRLLAFPLRTLPLGGMVDPEISRFPYKELPYMPGSATTPGQTDARDCAPAHVAFRTVDGVGTRDNTLSRLNGWPVCSPTDASPTPSRMPAHGSGPMWLATPSS